MRVIGRYFFSAHHQRSLKVIGAAIYVAGAVFLSSSPVVAQGSQPIQPGEAFVTGFSGTVSGGGGLVIDMSGTVGSIVDIGSPGVAPRGQLWSNAPRRGAVTAAQVGQVFGVALDDASPPNIYLTATSAFGLHRTSDNAGWMSGMWGANGGPGTVYKLDAANGYQPQMFANITLDGRENSGAALGNVAYDRWNKQLYVSDLETGMVHAISVADGTDLGFYDHGTQGRVSFTDAATGQPQALAPVAFHPGTAALTGGCPFGDFANTPACWNFADFRRRVRGLDVRRDKDTNEIRLYYSVWSSQGFGHPEWSGAGDEAKNSIWSVKIGADGGFDTRDVRRELILPDFFTDPAVIAVKGYSRPVADIAFPQCAAQNEMILAERGGVRNLGLDKDEAFAFPGEARVLRYLRDENGVWQLDGHLDVGMRQPTGKPLTRANAAGGAAFGFGYDASQFIDNTLVDGYLWITGDRLCLPEGQCFNPATGAYDDASQVYGIQGMASGLPAQGSPHISGIPLVPNSAYMVDIDGDTGRNDATRIGDVEIYQPCAATSADTEPPAYPGDAPAYPGGEPDPWATGPVPGGPPIYPGGAPGPQLPGSGSGSGPGPVPGGGTVIPPTPLQVDIVDLKIEKKSYTGKCKPGGKCKFKITIKNVGQIDYKGAISFTDTLPPGWTLDSYYGGLTAAWQCQPKGSNAFTCTFHPGMTVPSGAMFPPNSTDSVEVTANVPAGAKGPNVQNCATIKENPKIPQDPAARGNDRACAKVSLPVPQKTGLDLKIEKDIVGMIAGCRPDSECKFEITITNNGPNPYYQPVVFEDAMPVGWTFVKRTPIGWPKCDVTGRIVRCETNPMMKTTPPIISLKPKAKIKMGLVFKTPPAIYETVEVWNCAKVFPHPQAGDITSDNDKSCVLVKIPGDPKEKIAPDLEITKLGPAKCRTFGRCTYTIGVKNVGKALFDGRIRIIEESDPGVTYVSHKPNKPDAWSCKDLGAGRIQCDYNSGKPSKLAVWTPVNPYMTYPLTLTVDLPYLNATKHNPETAFLKDCVNLRGVDALGRTGPIDHIADNDRACVTTPVEVGSLKVTGSMDWSALLPWNWGGGGTISCTPPGCSFFEFTATLGKTDKSQAYNGALGMRISLPPGSNFPTARITRSGKSCAPGKWSITKTSDGFDLLNTACQIRPGEQVSVRMDGKVVPGMKVPPRVAQQRTACGVLEWVVPASKGGIEQQTYGIRNAKTCFTIKILPRHRGAALPKPVFCPAGWKPFASSVAVPKGWKQSRAGQAPNTIICAKQQRMKPVPSPTPALKCLRGWKKVPPGWTRRGWRVRQLKRGGAFLSCAKQQRVKPVPPPSRSLRCWKGWKKVSPGWRRRGWQVERIRKGKSSIFCARRQRVAPPVTIGCPAGTRLVGRRCITIRTQTPPARIYCPAGTRLVGRRCVTIRTPAPAPKAPPKVVPMPKIAPLQMIPGRIICPKGQVPFRGGCMKPIN